MAIFKAYDIRGIYSKELNEEIFEKIGNNLDIFNSPKTIVIGHDMRESSKPLKEALISGATKLGLNIIDLELASTPMLYQATYDFDVDLGIIITASHNSKEFNGMKICYKNAVPISYDTGLKELEQKVKNTKKLRDLKKTYTIKKSLNYKISYKNYILDNFVKNSKKPKIVFDAGNGMGGFIDLEILSKICNLVPLYTEMDGSFPNHEANPIKEENLSQLKKEVIKQKADFGIAFDGDADRIGFIDNKGKYIPADMVQAYLISHFLETHPEEEVYSFDLRSSKIIEEMLIQNNKTPIKTRVGHSYIKAIMKEKNSFFSAELSGHFYFWFNDKLLYDSAIRTSIELINAFSSEKKTFSELVNRFKVYEKSPEINFKVKNKNQVLKKLKSIYKESLIEEIDGLTIIEGNWWLNLRASNTENILRLNLEADNKELFDAKLKEVSEIISKFK